jgi:uncharacterized membrane protein YbhN (UPF0104 family)
VLFTAAAGLAVIAAFALADVAGWPALLPRFAHADTLWLAVCFGGQVLAYLGYVLAVRDMARVDDGPSLSFSLTTRTVVAGFGVYAATHAAGGFAVDYWALRRAGLNRQEATARVLGLGALEYAVLAPAALISAVVLLLGGAPHVQDAMTLPWLLAVPGFIAALWISSPRRSARFADPGDGGRARAAFAHAVAGVAKLRSLMTSPRRHGAGVIGVSLYWFGDIACLALCLRAYEGHFPSVAPLLIGYATGYALTRRTLPLAGAGAVEALLPFALSWSGTPLAAAVPAVLAYRVVNFWLPIVPAVFGLRSLRARA